MTYLNAVTGLRRLLEARGGTGGPDDGVALPGQARRPRIKQDFDPIQRAEYADRAFKQAGIENH